jgi:hypothetical protein
MPTREPIERCGNCAHRWHDKICMERVEVPFGPYCGCESRLRAPQPTAQAGEACKPCRGKGFRLVDHANGVNTFMEKCPDCNATGKVPAPPTPQPDGYYAEDGGWVDDPRSQAPSSAGEAERPLKASLNPIVRILMDVMVFGQGDGGGMDIDDAEEAIEALIAKRLEAEASPQLPTLLQILEAHYGEPVASTDTANDEVAAEITQLYNQRFEAALAHHETLTGAEYVSREAARKVWYEGGTNHE